MIELQTAAEIERTRRAGRFVAVTLARAANSANGPVQG